MAPTQFEALRFRIPNYDQAVSALIEDVIERPCGPHDYLATIYHRLGIDYDKVTIDDFNGRPTPIVNLGKTIPELIGWK